MPASTECELPGGLLEPSDHELIRGIGEGREESCVLFFRRWAPRLGRFLLRATGSREAADDLLQETFLRVLRFASRFEPRGSAAAWLYRIAANVLYSDWRRRRARAGVDLELAAMGQEGFTGGARAPQEARLGRDFRREAGQALGRLPANQRLVFLMKADQGLTYEEIAGVLDCPVGTAKSRFHGAVLRLRAELKDWDEVPSAGGNPHAV